MIQAEKGVPLPDNSMRRRRLKYPWAEMEVNESFVIENASVENARSQVGAANVRYAPRRFTAKAVDGKRLRVWRLY